MVYPVKLRLVQRQLRSCWFAHVEVGNDCWIESSIQDAAQPATMIVVPRGSKEVEAGEDQGAAKVLSISCKASRTATNIIACYNLETWSICYTNSKLETKCNDNVIKELDEKRNDGQGLSFSPIVLDRDLARGMMVCSAHKYMNNKQLR